MRQTQAYFLLIAILGFKLSAEVIIDNINLNGSFETGAATPWSVGTSGDGLLVVEDPTFTCDGTWYAEIDIDAGRAYVGQHITSITPTVTDSFTLSFKARKGSPGPGSISAGMSSYKANGDWLGANRIETNAPELSETEWQDLRRTESLFHGRRKSLWFGFRYSCCR
jgi:hypothetical protein